LPENLVESELFGYEKGAFTGAIAARPGKFELAHRGTLFLDEIGDMEISTQAKILRAVESGAVERVGGTKATSVDVRMISATNKDLQGAIRQNQFRGDLFFRIAAMTLYLPPLRERRDDIPLLIERFWADLQGKYSRPGPELTREALLRLQEASWPGNVRQLRNTVEKLFVLPRENKVTADDVRASLGDQSHAPPSPLEGALSATDFREAKRMFEIEYITRKLNEHGGNVTRTASSIGIERQSLQEKIRKLGVLRQGNWES
jgi:two-component system, NtrC family, nitrogen regulation response regulator NtrX